MKLIILIISLTSFITFAQCDTSIFHYSTLADPIEIQPQFAGGQAAMIDFIDSAFTYPNIETQNSTGKVWIQFRIDTTGSLDSFKVTKGMSTLLDEEALRVVQSFPKFTPYYVNGKKTTIRYNVSVKINKELNKVPAIICETPIPPKYPGGMLELNRFINSNFEFQKDTSISIIGCMTIWMSFVVDENGSVEDVTVVRGISEVNNEEILRVFSIMPKWIPAEPKAKIKYSLPIKILL